MQTQGKERLSEGCLQYNIRRLLLWSKKKHMKALILAAGLGTRLRPFTDTMPKALAEVGGKTVLEIIAERLIAAGVTHIVVNVHHLAPLMKSFIAGLHYDGVSFYISDETEGLLDTGGGILKARPLLKDDEPFWVYNADILADIDLGSMRTAHLKSGAIATLAVSNRKATRVFLWENGLLAGWENLVSGEQILCKPGKQLHNLEQKAFSGIHLLSQDIFSLITETGAFSIKDVYLRLAADMPVGCYTHEAEVWMETGTPESLERARRKYCGQ